MYVLVLDVMYIIRSTSFSETQRSGLSLRDDHYNERHRCLDKFAEVYGGMPLMYSSITAVQYSQGLELPKGIKVIEHL